MSICVIVKPKTDRADTVAITPLGMIPYWPDYRKAFTAGVRLGFPQVIEYPSKEDACAHLGVTADKLISGENLTN